MATARERTRCRFFDKPIGCRNADNCPFLHPGEEEVAQVPICRFYSTPRGCRYGEKCYNVHEGPKKIEMNEGKSMKTSGKATSAKKASTSGVKYELKNGLVKGPPSHLGVPLPPRPSNPDKTLTECGECHEMVHGEDELYNHYYINLIEMNSDHMELFENNASFKRIHQCCRCAAKFEDYMPYFEHMVKEVKEGCYSHWKNLDDTVWRLVRRDRKEVSERAALRAILSNSKCYEDYFNDTDESSDASDDDADYNGGEDEDEWMGCYGFSPSTFNMLLSYGVKPWEEDAHDFLEQLEKDRQGH